MASPYARWVYAIFPVNIAQCLPTKTVVPVTTNYAPKPKSLWMKLVNQHGVRYEPKYPVRSANCLTDNNNNKCYFARVISSA